MHEGGRLKMHHRLVPVHVQRLLRRARLTRSHGGESTSVNDQLLNDLALVQHY